MGKTDLECVESGRLYKNSAVEPEKVICSSKMALTAVMKNNYSGLPLTVLKTSSQQKLR